MQVYKKEFSYFVEDLEAAKNAGKILYDIADWLVSLDIGFTSYGKSETTDGTNPLYKYWNANIMHISGKTVNMRSKLRFNTSDGEITGIYGNGGCDAFYIENTGYGTVDLQRQNYRASQYAALPSYNNGVNSNLKFVVTVYYKNDTNIIIGIEDINNKTEYGFGSGMFMFLLTAGGEQLLTNSMQPLCSQNSDGNYYGVLTDGKILKYNIRAILDANYLGFTDGGIVVKVPVIDYGQRGNTKYEGGISVDYLKQTNKSYMKKGSVYLIGGIEYLCINERDGIMFQC